MNKEYAMRLCKKVKQINPEIQGFRLAMQDYGFAYYYNEKAVVIPQIKDEEDYDWENWMYEYLKETFDLILTTEKEMDIFSVLHEIGHHMNRDSYNTELYNRLYDEVDDDDYLAYRQIPDEYKADKWAVEFMKKHKEELMNL